ncbi:MAG: transposase [Spirochaetaceae bacterium]|nr:transposase [Spirochaetaceae bacterium]
MHRHADAHQAHARRSIRMAFCDDEPELFMGPAEVDEPYFGAKERNKHADKRTGGARATAGKSIVAGVKDRETNQISAAVVDTTRKRELQSFVAQRIVARRHHLHRRSGQLPRPPQPQSGEAQRRPVNRRSRGSGTPPAAVYLCYHCSKYSIYI